ERRGRVGVFGQLMLDDIQVDRAAATDRKPPSYAVTLGARGAIGAAATAWRVYYTRVTNLTYRNEDSLQVPLYHSLGTGRNFDDYDQLTGTLALLPARACCSRPRSPTSARAKAIRACRIRPSRRMPPRRRFFR